MLSKKVIGAIAALAVLSLIANPVEVATAEEEQPEVEIIDIRMVTPPPQIPERVIEIRTFDHDPEELETLARLLWSSPLRDESEKEKLLWVVLNRVTDDSDTFGNSIRDVVTKNEFSFYDRKAHLSETNLRIAQEVMDAWLSELFGFYVGEHVPSNGLYIRFVGDSNRGLEVTAERGGEALAW